MRQFITLLIIVCSYSLSAQSSFMKVYGSIHHEGASVVHAVPNGYVLGGYSYDHPGGEIQIALTRVNDDGDLVWCKKYDGGSYAYFSDFTVNTSGGFYVFGVATFGILISKVDSNGNMLWNKCFHDNLPTSLGGIYATSDGGFIFTTRSDSVSNSGWGNKKVVKCNSAGSMQWVKTFTAVFGYDHILECSNGDILVAGSDIIRLDANGNLLWSKEFIGKGYIVDMTWSGNNILLLRNDYFYTTQDNYAVQSQCVDVNGNTLWTQRYDDQSNGLLANAFTITSAGTVVITGLSSYFNAAECFIFETDANGLLLSSYRFTGAPFISFADVEATSSGQIAAAGNVRGVFSASDSASVLLAKMNLNDQSMCGQSPLLIMMSSDTITEVTVFLSPVSAGWLSTEYITSSSGCSELTLCSVGLNEVQENQIGLFPNPATEYITIETPELPGATFVIYNSRGEIVLSEYLQSSTTIVSLSSLSSGLYFYQLRVDATISANGKFTKQ